MRNELIPSNKSIDHHPAAFVIHFKSLNIHFVLRFGPKLFEVSQHNLHHPGNLFWLQGEIIEAMCTFI